MIFDGADRTCEVSAAGRWRIFRLVEKSLVFNGPTVTIVLQFKERLR